MAILQITAKEWDEVLGAKGVAGLGDTVELLPGEYTGRIFPILRSGAPDAPITVQCQPGVLFDGAYRWPDGPALNTGPGGEVIYRGLIQPRGSHVHLNLDGARLTRTRGHGVHAYGTAAAPLSNVQVNGLVLNGLRSAGIRFDYVNGFKALRNKVRDAGNYYPSFRDGSLGGWPMVINCVSSEDGEMAYNQVTDSWGEGIQASRGSRNVKVHHNSTRRMMGVHYYAHGGDDIWVYCNVAHEYGDYLRAGSPPDLMVINPGELQYEGKQNLGAHRTRIFNNLLVGGYHNLGVWAGGAAPLDDCLIAFNTLVNARAGAKQTGYGSIVVRGTDNVSGLRFLGNMFHQDDGQYGAADKRTWPVWESNGWNGAPPFAWVSDTDWVGVKLRNPDAPVAANALDLRNYEPLQPLPVELSFVQSIALSSDLRDNLRWAWTVGALEFPQAEPPPPPPPPTEEQVRLVLSMMLEPGLAEQLRAAIAQGGVKVTIG